MTQKPLKHISEDIKPLIDRMSDYIANRNSKANVTFLDELAFSQLLMYLRTIQIGGLHIVT
jgi:hypothetical protein